MMILRRNLALALAGIGFAAIISVAPVQAQDAAPRVKLATSMGDIVVQSFAEVPADTMKGVRVLFIGAAADNERVATAVAPAGVDYVFIEAK